VYVHIGLFSLAWFVWQHAMRLCPSGMRHVRVATCHCRYGTYCVPTYIQLDATYFLCCHVLPYCLCCHTLPYYPYGHVLLPIYSMLPHSGIGTSNYLCWHVLRYYLSCHVLLSIWFAAKYYETCYLSMMPCVTVNAVAWNIQLIMSPAKEDQKGHVFNSYSWQIIVFYIGDPVMIFQ